MPARRATASIVTPWNPCSPTSSLVTSRSCSRRWAALMRCVRDVTLIRFPPCSLQHRNLRLCNRVKARAHTMTICDQRDRAVLDDETVLPAEVVVAGAGPLSEPASPDIPGLRDFQGTVFHSATWDHDHDLDGERVAVIGTGASAIQFVPQIQPRVGKLHVFQRTAPWIMPRPDRPLTRFERALYRRVPAAQRLMRKAIYWGREAYAIPLLRVRLSRVIERAARRHLRRQVPDPQLQAKLTPDYAPGCKRILVSNDYLPALARPNVEVVCDGIADIRERSVVTRDGTEREVDTIILGTGFHVTDLPIAERLRGRGGRSLAEHWEGSLQAH